MATTESTDKSFVGTIATAPPKSTVRTTLADLATDGLGDDRLPNFAVYRAAAECTQDTLDRLAPSA